MLLPDTMKLLRASAACTDGTKAVDGTAGRSVFVTVRTWVTVRTLFL